VRAREHRAVATSQPTPTGPQQPKKKRNPWIWISAILVLVAAGLLIWALTIQSDLDSTQKDVNELEAQVEQGQSAGSELVTAAKGVYDDLAAELGATAEDLEATQQELDDAQQAADDAEQVAADAKQAVENADNATDKAQAEADQAKAEVQAAESKAAIAGDCAKAYVSAIGSVLEGGEAASVRDQLQAITADCKTALADA
jgi:hypothetical protein